MLGGEGSSHVTCQLLTGEELLARDCCNQRAIDCT